MVPERGGKDQCTWHPLGLVFSTLKVFSVASETAELPPEIVQSVWHIVALVNLPGFQVIFGDLSRSFCLALSSAKHSDHMIRRPRRHEKH